MSVDIAAARELIAGLDAADCCGPLTTFGLAAGVPDGAAKVGIVCKDYVAVIQWIAYAVSTMPELLDEIERLRAALGRACDQIDEHHREYDHLTSPDELAAWRTLSEEAT